ncbi:hypothetical protein B7993_15950 [Fibrobacter sp. UWH3]|nr:hypothetical protein B7993_15950 [Fibrobacter sp. UWH3]
MEKFASFNLIGVLFEPGENTKGKPDVKKALPLSNAKKGAGASHLHPGLLLIIRVDYHNKFNTNITLF